MIGGNNAAGTGRSIRTRTKSDSSSRNDAILAAKKLIMNEPHQKMNPECKMPVNQLPFNHLTNYHYPDYAKQTQFAGYSNERNLC